MQNAGLGDSQAGIKIVGRNINSRRYADDTTVMSESKEELKCLLMKVKEKSEKAGLKLRIQPFTSLQPRRQHGSPAALLEPSEKVRPGFSLLPGLLKPARSDPEIRPQYVPPVFPPV